MGALQKSVTNKHIKTNTSFSWTEIWIVTQRTGEHSGEDWRESYLFIPWCAKCSACVALINISDNLEKWALRTIVPEDKPETSKSMPCCPAGEQQLEPEAKFTSVCFLNLRSFFCTWYWRNYEMASPNDQEVLRNVGSCP